MPWLLMASFCGIGRPGVGGGGQGGQCRKAQKTESWGVLLGMRKKSQNFHIVGCYSENQVLEGNMIIRRYVHITLCEKAVWIL